MKLQQHSYSSRHYTLPSGNGKAAKQYRNKLKKLSSSVNDEINIFDFTEEEQIFAICKRDMVNINANLSELANLSANMHHLMQRLKLLGKKTNSLTLHFDLLRISVRFAINIISVKILNLKV